MLPDLPALKKDLQEVLNKYLRVQVKNRMGFAKGFQRQIIHEGNRLRVIRSDGSVEDSELKQASSEFFFNLECTPPVGQNMLG